MEKRKNQQLIIDDIKEKPFGFECAGCEGQEHPFLCRGCEARK